MSDSILSVTKPVEVNLNLDVAKRTKLDNINQLKLDVYKSVLDILLVQKEIDNEAQKLVIEQDKLKTAQEKNKLGIVTKDDLNAAQYNVDSKQLDVDSAKQKLDTYYMKLKDKVNMPLDTKPVKITEALVLAPFKDVDIDYTIYNLNKTATSAYEASEMLKIAQTAMDIAAKLYKPGDVTYDDTSIDLDGAKLDFDNAQKAIEVNVKNKYNDLANMADNIELSQKYLDLTNKKLANAQLKYDKGLLDKTSLLNLKESCLDAGYANFSAIHDYNAVEIEFENLTGQKL
jgi:outer membrane protein TolC